MTEIDQNTGEIIHKCDNCGNIISRGIIGVGVVGKPSGHKCPKGDPDAKI